MAKDLNKVQLTGHLGADPEMRYTPQGSAVTTFRVASGRQWKDGNGEPREETEWFRIVAWDKLGEICNQYLTKGSHVYVEGRLQTRKWQDQNGNDRYSTEVIAQDMIMLGGRRDGAGPVEVEEDAAPAPAAPDAAARRQDLREGVPARVAARPVAAAPADLRRAAPAAAPTAPARRAPVTAGRDQDEILPF